MSSTIWLTDRSRYTEGLDRCQRARFLSYHSGPSGYGIVKKAHSLPLATGVYYHEGLAGVLSYVQQHDALPSDEVVRAAIQHAVQAYRDVCAVRGLELFGEDFQTVVVEQSTLIEGLIWAFVLRLLPWIHEQARVIQVEHDTAAVVGCTCGLGDFIGLVEDHEGRACEGIGFQYRLDFLTEYRARPGVVAYWEFKGTAATGERFDTQWETMPQFPLGALMESKRLEVDIQECWVIGLVKGRREGDTWNPDTKTREGIRRQQSVLCYGYKKPGNPPFEEEDWQAEYDYKDEWGKGHRLGKAYQKEGIWALAPQLAGSPVTPSEFWCKWMAPETLGKQIALVGPLPVNPIISAHIVEELVAEEQRWKQIQWQLADAIEASGWDWTHPTYQQALRRLVPRSWSCRRYGKRHQCQFVPVCFEHEGWQDPLAGDRFIVRRPHHKNEMAQMEARGLTPPEGWAEDEEEDS